MNEKTFYKLVKVTGYFKEDGEYRFHQIDWLSGMGGWAIVGTVRMDKETAEIFFGKERVKNALTMRDEYYTDIWFSNPE